MVAEGHRSKPGLLPRCHFGNAATFLSLYCQRSGEGTQAKRRAQAVIIDHLTPPLTRAEGYGALAELERQVDEYFQASGLDPRRLTLLKKAYWTMSGPWPRSRRGH